MCLYVCKHKKDFIVTLIHKNLVILATYMIGVIMKRVSLMIKEDQYQVVSDSGLNLSGLVRDLLDDHFSEHKITLSVSEETRKLYDLIVSNTGSTDEDVEKYLKDTLKLLLDDRIKAMQVLQKDIFSE